MAQKKILVVDDEPSICEGVASILSRAGFEVKQAGSGEDAVRLNREEAFDLVLMDLIMPGMDGARACAEIKRMRPRTTLLAISGSPSGHRIDDFVKNGGIELILYKPFGKDELLSGVERALSMDLSSPDRS